MAERNAQAWRLRYLGHRTPHNRRMAEVWSALARMPWTFNLDPL